MDKMIFTEYRIMIDNIARILMSSSDGEGGNGGVSGSDIALYILSLIHI